MKNQVMIFCVFLLLLVVFLSNVSADINNTQITQAYSCLQNKTVSCSTSLDDNIFTLLSLGTCQSNIISASSNNGQCWPSSGCNVAETSKVMFALKAANADISTPLAWLLTKNRTASNLEWYIQVESSNPTSCTASYSGHSYPFSIDSSKQITSGAGNCLSISENGYWLQVSSSSQCQTQYQISCDQDFLTTTLFKDISSDTIHVSNTVHSASSSGTTTEQVNSQCFADSSGCSYEGTLWGALALKLNGNDPNPYLPYLVTQADNNPRYLPEAFLYMFLGQNYRNNLLSKQQSNEYWSVSGDKFYDTALALFALQPDDVTQKTNAINWLMSTQDNQGCWQGNIKDTGFILYAIAPRSSNGGGTTTLPDCETNGNYCVSSLSCTNAGGNILNGYQCASGLLSCCNKQPQTQTCLSQGGIICSSNQTCSGGTTVDASDVTSSFGTCCINGGVCVSNNNDNGSQLSQCQLNGGNCRTGTCESGEQQNSALSCDFSSQICCLTSSSTSSSSSLWIWILAILIVLVLIAILLRHKLREFWFRMKSGGKPRPSGPGNHGPLPMFPERRFIPRRILPHAEQRSQQPRKSGELDEVLKKLKDMSK